MLANNKKAPFSSGLVTFQAFMPQPESAAADKEGRQYPARIPLERLKKILRLALQEQAQRIKLQAGTPLELLTQKGPQYAPAEGPVEPEYLQTLFQYLFPNDKAAIATGQTTKGMLNVPNVGRILLIAHPVAPASLRLYLPPHGQPLFESDWQRLSSKTVTPPVAIPAAPTGLTPPVAMPMSVQAPLQPLPLEMHNPEPPPPQVMKPATPAGYGGFIPTGMAPPPAEAPSMPPNAQPAPTAPPLAMAPAPHIPAVAPVVAFAPAPLAAAAAFPEPAFAPLGRAQHAPEEAPAVISFGPTAEGEADVSNGENAIDRILTDMVKRKASDLHMTCGEPLCFRVDGEIQRITQTPTTPEEIQNYLLPIMPVRNQAEFIKINDTDFAYEIRGVGRFRVNIFRDKNGVGSVMRHIPSTILTAEQLSLPPAITKFCHLTKGLVLVTGPTGSGKSTTLAAMIDLINKTRPDHILTVEDPIEFVHSQQKSLVNQREVHKHTGSFARALKAALREDPDIVLIGEMRDLETVAIAIETAETGHLVFGTLHTNTAVSTIDRIVDQFPTDRQEQIRMMLSSSLKGVVAQTLLRKKTGGRVAAHEILVTNDAVSAMIREGKNHMIPNHMQSQKQDGNLLLNESLLKLVKDQIVETDDALRKSVDKTSLIEMFKRAGIRLPVEAGVAPKAPAAGKQSA